MAGRVLRHFPKGLPFLNGREIRHGHVLRGRPPTDARTLRQRLDSLNNQDPEVSFKVDIGFPVQNRRSRESWMVEQKASRSNPEIERLARKRELLVDLDRVQEAWFESDGPSHIKSLAEHYGIYRDLFGDAYFFPVVGLNVKYTVSNETAAKVYRGNVVKSADARRAPTVEYVAGKDTLWTLLMTSPDGNLDDSSKEYCHWFVGNIPGSAIQQGEKVIDYLRPITPRGVGYFRYIFVLYKQEKALDYGPYKKAEPCLSLSDRNWDTLEFYRKHQEYLTPAGLAFFQADWDPSIKDFYHNVLKAREPVCQYDFPKAYVRPQEWFPIGRAFNTYLDRYKDPKDVIKRYLLKKLVNVHPFEKAAPPLKFPNAHPYSGNAPSWLKVEIKKDRLGWGRINDL